MCKSSNIRNIEDLGDGDRLGFLRCPDWSHDDPEKSVEVIRRGRDGLEFIYSVVRWSPDWLGDRAVSAQSRPLEGLIMEVTVYVPVALVGIVGAWMLFLMIKTIIEIFT